MLARIGRYGSYYDIAKLFICYLDLLNLFNRSLFYAKIEKYGHKEILSYIRVFTNDYFYVIIIL